MVGYADSSSDLPLIQSDPGIEVSTDILGTETEDVGPENAPEVYIPPDTSIPPVDAEPDVYVPPVDVFVPIDVSLPPEDTYTPPVDTYVPPADVYTPPEDTSTPPTDTYVAPDLGPEVPDTYVPPDPCANPPGYQMFCKEGDPLICLSESVFECKPDGKGCFVWTPTVICNDGLKCTTDACVPAVGCVYTPVSCDDSNVCTTDSCDESDGCVQMPLPLVDDGDPCTETLCDPTTGPYQQELHDFCASWVDSTPDGCEKAALQALFIEVAANLPTDGTPFHAMTLSGKDPTFTPQTIHSENFAGMAEWITAVADGVAPLKIPSTGLYTFDTRIQPNGFWTALVSNNIQGFPTGHLFIISLADTSPCDFQKLDNVPEQGIPNIEGNLGDTIMFYWDYTP